MLAIHSGKLSESGSRAVSIIYNLQNIRENMYLELSKSCQKAAESCQEALGHSSTIQELNLNRNR
jgi:hypothetical protein